MAMDALGQPKVVALVPTWNAEAFLAETLDSLAAQTYANIEVLISDDASSDNTAAVCDRYTRAHSHFSYMRQRSRLGWVANVNWLLDAAHGDYFLFAFHDDILYPTYIETLIQSLESNPRAILAFSDVETVYSDGRREMRRYAELEGVASGARRARAMLRQTWGLDFWSVPNRGVFRAAAAKRIGGLKKHWGGEYSADWPWLVHMAVLGDFVRVPKVLVEKRYKPGSLSRTWHHGLLPWYGAVSSCARELWISDLTFRESAPLYAFLIYRVGIRTASAIVARSRNAGFRAAR